MEDIGRSVRPIRPRVTTNHAAISAEHSRSERRHRNVIAESVNVDHGAVATVRARYSQPADAVLTHVA
jgi:hypothetical protein